VQIEGYTRNVGNNSKKKYSSKANATRDDLELAKIMSVQGF